MNTKKLWIEFEKFTFLIPALALFIFVIAIPFIQGIGISMTNWDGIGKDYDFVGFKNLLLLFKDEAAITPIKNTLLYTVLVVVLVNAIGLMLAIGLNQKFRGANLLRSAIFSPMVTSLVLAAFVWTYLYLDVFPLLFGIKGLLGSVDTVMYGIIFICVWRDSGLAMVIYYAGLQSIPEELDEAARIDGANIFQKFKTITFPMLAPAFTTCITLWLGWCLKVFDYPMAATSGGPGDASTTFAIYVYNYMFPFNKAGYGQMAALVMMACVILISSVTTSFLRRREVEL